MARITRKWHDENTWTPTVEGSAVSAPADLPNDIVIMRTSPLEEWQRLERELAASRAREQELRTALEEYASGDNWTEEEIDVPGFYRTYQVFCGDISPTRSEPWTIAREALGVKD